MDREDQNRWPISSIHAFLAALQVAGRSRGTAACPVADCSASFFRIFNPLSQGAQFDPDGNYVRRWVPELAGLANDWIQQALGRCGGDSRGGRGVSWGTLLPSAGRSWCSA